MDHPTKCSPSCRHGNYTLEPLLLTKVEGLSASPTLGASLIREADSGQLVDDGRGGWCSLPGHQKLSSRILPCRPLLLSMLCVLAGEAGPVK